MSTHAPVAALRVANEAFLVSSTIERCPKTMMLRELVVNAIEAADVTSHEAPQAAAGRRHVDITSAKIDGVSKLCIRNTGRGMSAAELDRICDLASSLHKQNSLDANFGMGAKVASLPSNKHGLRYRSCKDGVASEVILGQRDGVYGRLRRDTAADGSALEVIDCTEACRAEGYNLAEDWTEVVLFGNSAGQNTVLDPYAGNPKMERDWLSKALFLRFFRIPAAVTVLLAPEITGAGAPRRMETLAEIGARMPQKETVRTPSGITLHYGYDPSAGTAERPAGMGCIVYKDEAYDPLSEARWVLEAPSYGIPFGAKFVSVYVELPDDYLVRPEGYRQFLRFRGGDQRQVFVYDFAQLVTAYMPAWLKAVIRSHGPQQDKFVGEVEDELRALVAELEIDPEFAPPPAPNQPKPVEKAAEQSDAAKTPPKPAAPPPKKYEKPPEIISLDNDELIVERGLKGRAAKFYATSHQLFINLKYPAIAALGTQLEAEYDAALNPERMRAIAHNVAGWAITRKIARALVYSLSKKAAGWPAEDVKRAQSAETFSLVADDWKIMVEPARLRMEAELGPDWQPAADIAEPGRLAQAA